VNVEHLVLPWALLISPLLVALGGEWAFYFFRTFLGRV